MITNEIIPVTGLLDRLHSYKISFAISSCFEAFIGSLRDDLWCYIEYPYVDRIYRDAYYHFYASKLDNYSRDCLRVSFFSREISTDLFFNEAGQKTLQEHFLGFSVFRLPPNSKNPGRTALAPHALKTLDFICELAPICATVGGVKLTVDAFPFSSQDGECMTCAETSLWAVKEYYGNKYPEHNITLPSEIHKAFQHNTRVLPSEGLTVLQIASALTNFGFGTYLYSRKKNADGTQNPAEDELFRRNLFYYIESGIPIILGLNNNSIGHAVVAIGHQVLSCTEIAGQVTTHLAGEAKNGIVDTADVKRNLVFIDDNYPPYQSANFFAPCTYYTDPRFADAKIEHFVVPLYHRIYLDARKASHLLNQVIEDPFLGWKKMSALKDQLLIKRIFLTSSSSYKSVTLKSDMHMDLKRIIQALQLPKFMWIAELSTPDLFSERRACGLVLLDATGSDRLQSISMVLYPKYMHILNEDLTPDYGSFSIYRNNLKGAL